MKNQWVTLGLVFLSAQALGSLSLPRSVDVKHSDVEVTNDAPVTLKNYPDGSDIFQDASHRLFWEELEKESADYFEANDDNLEEFPWSLTSDGSDDEDNLESDAITDLNVAHYGDLGEISVEALSVEERINFKAIGGWIQNKAQQVGSTAKAAFIKLGGKQILEVGLKLIKTLKVSVDPISCANASCGSCIYVDVPPLNGHKACLRFGMLEKGKIGALFRVGERILFEQSIGLSSKALCPSFPFPVGSVCLQSVQVTKNGSDMGFCMMVVIKQYKVGGQFCVKLDNGRLKPAFKAMRVPAEEQFNTVFILDENNKVEEVTGVVDIATPSSTSQTATALVQDVSVNS